MGVVRAAVASGDHRKALEAIANNLASALDRAPASVKAQIAGQLRAALSDLRALPTEAPLSVEGVTTIDDAKRARAERQSAAQVATDAATGGGNRRR